MHELIDHHIAHLRRANNRPATIRDRRNTLLRLQGFLDGLNLADAQLADLERWQDHTRDRVAASSLLTYTAHVRAFYTWAYERDHLPANPARHLVRPRIPRAVPRPIPARDLRIAMATARGDVIPMLLLGAYLGLRAGEMAGMRGEDVVRVGPDTFLIVRGKGGRERAVPLVPALLARLAPYLPVRGPVLRTPRGRSCDLAARDYVTSRVGGHFDSLGMSHTTHQLRHSAATRLLQLTQNPRQVQEILGHADLSQTALYTEISSAESVRAMRLLAGDLAIDAPFGDELGETEEAA
jgi:site-specific recombinase XerD